MLSTKIGVICSLTLFSTCHAIKLDISPILSESYRHDYSFDDPNKTQTVSFTRVLPLSFYLQYRHPIAQQLLLDNNITQIKLYVGTYFLAHRREPIFGRPATGESTQAKVDNINNFYLSRVFSTRDIGLTLSCKFYNRFSVEYQFSRALMLKEDGKLDFNKGLRLFLNRKAFHGRFVYIKGATGMYTAFVKSNALVFTYHISKILSISLRIQKDGFIRKRSGFLNPNDIEEQVGLINSYSLQINYKLNSREL
jgi:hypothetical protein